MENYLAGGVNSPIPIPDNYPKAVVRGEGPYVFDEGGRKYIDLWMGYGALLFGHSDKSYRADMQSEIHNGWFFSYPTLLEQQVSRILHEIIPSAESVRFATTGSDAVAYAIRASRAFTGKETILSIVGGYHGVHEGMNPLEKNPKNLKRIAFNDTDALKKEIESGDYACFILEPVLANDGCVPATREFLEHARKYCSKNNTVLIFDEIVTGFRLHIGGAQTYYNVTPDISLFSKAMAGGLPLSAICGKKDILETFIPIGKVFFAGTFNGHPLALSNVKLTVSKLRDGAVHERLNALGDSFRNSVQSLFDKYHVSACAQGIGSMISLAFETSGYTSALTPDTKQRYEYNQLVVSLAQKGVLMPPLATETIFLSEVHAEVMTHVLQCIEESIVEIWNK